MVGSILDEGAGLEDWDLFTGYVDVADRLY